MSISCPIVFSWISLMIWNLFPFKDDFRKKPEVTGHQIWAVVGLSHPGDLMFRKKTLHESDMWAGALLWCSCQSAVVRRCGLLSHPSSFCGGMFKLHTKFDADLSHTVHMLTQQHLTAPLTSTAKLSLFTRAQTSPLSVAARLHRCHANRSHYINNGWTFSRQTLYVCIFL